MASAEHYKIAVIGSGPGGLSAAGHAAELGESHILLEKTDKPSNTIQKYQKGKHVMAEPGILPLRSPMRFAEGKREDVLEAWVQGLQELKVNIRYNADVSEISKEAELFRIACMDGSKITADAVILGIGVQGNPRLLGCEGENLGFVKYQLDDPAEHNGDTIVVVGAGDAAIENALALARNNKVAIVNRRDEFARAKEGNLALIQEAIKKGKIECFYKSSADHIEAQSDGKEKATFVLKTDAGLARVPCDHIIARLGAIPQRKLVESFGIEFPNDAADAIPQLSSRYESNVEGLYVIGALAGYPLIKQAMNQGYEVVEYILGNEVKPADHPLLEKKLQVFPELEVEQALDLMQQRIPVFEGVNALQFRELILDSEVRALKPGELIFKRNDYTNTFFTIVEGEVEIRAGDDESFRINVGQGNFFGEMSLLSGRRRSATTVAASECILIETPRRTMVKLINSVQAVERALDEVFILRAIQSSLAPNVPVEYIQQIAQEAELEEFAPNEVLFSEGDVADKLHFIRSGSLTVSKNVGGRNVVLAYVPANNYVGEIGLLSGSSRSATVRAAVRTETISLNRACFEELMEWAPELRRQVEETASERLAEESRASTEGDSGDLISFLMQQGLGTATDVLLIDEDLCVACDNCERACAESHDGTSRLDREAGPTFASLHVPTSCRHCEDPKCMQECPPDAIRRSAAGEVYIEDSCIGCGNCARNCPYDVIQMAVTPPKKPGLLAWMLLGRGPGPGEDKTARANAPKDAVKKAVKCDMCMNLAGGPSCVRACPTGAAIRISPENFSELGRGRQ